jgi:peptide/nickel transport system permease protein
MCSWTLGSDIEAIRVTFKLAPRPIPFWRRLLHNVGAIVGVALLFFVVLVAVLAPWIAPQDPYKLDVMHKFQPPDAMHIMGTDDLGRDVFSRVVMGSRISFQVALEVLLLAGTIGILLGGLAGYRGGLIDEAVMRLADIFLAFPSFLLAMAVVAALGSGIEHTVLAIGVAWWPRYARLLRAQVLTVRERPFVEAARSLGANGFRIMRLHILPNCLAPLIIQVTMDAGEAILTTASLSFVGLGAPPPLAEWGAMVAQGRAYIASFWWVPGFPGLGIALTVAGYMFLGDGLRDLWDPQLRGHVRF